MDLGSAQGMLRSHILIRERTATMSEPERAEVLLHEVGHYLGAVHSPDPTSVMRPILDDDKAIHRTFEIGFDPVNALIINLIAEDIRQHDAASVAQLSLATRARLSEIYGALAKAVPNDKSVRQYRAQIDMTGDTPLFQATRLVVREVGRAAESRHLGEDGEASRLAADKLTEYLVRRGASVAMTLPADVAPSALILGLGIALDDSDTLLRIRFTRDFCLRVESAAERQARQRALGKPTILGRRDLAQHFFLSAYLTAIVGSAAAESAGLAKELADSQSTSGFSYRDLAADLAGIEFARQLIRGKLSPPQVAANFTVANVMPPVDDLPEGLDGSEIGNQLQSQGEGSMAHYVLDVRRRIKQLSHPAASLPAGNE